MGWFYKLLCKLLPHVVIENNGAPYLTRWFLTGKPKYEEGESGSLYLHYFHTSDRDRALHNHPWTGTSLILKGGYWEERRTFVGMVDGVAQYSPSRAKVCSWLTVNKIGIHDFHCATLLDEKKGAWTLFFTGPRVKDWGFLTREDNKFTPWRKFLGIDEGKEKSYRN